MNFFWLILLYSFVLENSSAIVLETFVNFISDSNLFNDDYEAKNSIDSLNAFAPSNVTNLFF